MIFDSRDVRAYDPNIISNTVEQVTTFNSWIYRCNLDCNLKSSNYVDIVCGRLTRRLHFLSVLNCVV